MLLLTAISLVFCIGGLYGNVLFFDNFNRPDGPVGNGWTKTGPVTLTIEDSTMKAISPAGRVVYNTFTTSSSGDVYFQFDWKVTDNPWYVEAFPIGNMVHLLYGYNGSNTR